MFLDSHPAKQLALPRNVDRSKFGHNYSSNEMVTQSDLSHIREGILLNHSAQMTERLAAWTAARKLDAESFMTRNNSGAVAKQKRLQKQALMAAVETLFINLKRLQHSFNTFARGTELHVTDCPIDEDVEPLQINKYGEVEKSVCYVRTRFSTPLSSLAIRGRDSRIEFFVVPTSLVMALSVIEDQLVPIATLSIKVEDGHVSWKSEDVNGPLQDPEEFAMWLFDKLIEQSKVACEPASHRKKQQVDRFERGYISEDFEYQTEHSGVGGVEKNDLASRVDSRMGVSRNGDFYSSAGLDPRQQKSQANDTLRLPILLEQQLLKSEEEFVPTVNRHNGNQKIVAKSAPCEVIEFVAFDYRKAWG